MSSLPDLEKFPTALVLRHKFQEELNFNEWSQQDLKPFIKDTSLAMLMKKSQIDSIKSRRFLSHDELLEQKKASDLKRRSREMLATVDHGVFDQAIIEGNFDPELIPFLRISDLSDKAVAEVINTIHAIAEKSEQKKELSDHIFDNLSEKNISELVSRSPRGLEGDYWTTITPYLRSHGDFNEAVDSLFSSAKKDEELYKVFVSHPVFTKLRFAELNDMVVRKIRRAMFHAPTSVSIRNMSVSKENIAELIRRPGGLDDVSVANSFGGVEYSVFTAFLMDDRLTGDIMEYALSEKPDLLNSIHSSRLMNRIPKDILKDIVFGDKSSELFREIFRIALGANLEVKDREYDRGKYVSLSIDQIEELIRNPHIISREEFEEIENNREEKGNMSRYTVKKIYKNSVKGTEEAAPEDFRDRHLDLLNKRFRSILGLEEESTFHILLDGKDSVYTRF